MLTIYQKETDHTARKLAKANYVNKLPCPDPLVKGKIRPNFSRLRRVGVTMMCNKLGK